MYGLSSEVCAFCGIVGAASVAWELRSSDMVRMKVLVGDSSSE